MGSRVSIAELIRGYYAAYERKDRDAIETLLTADFTFSSPLDKRIRRVAYFRRCWPNCQKIRAFHIEKLIAEGDDAFALYELEPNVGPRFRNAEFFRMKGNMISEVQVYFGSRVGTVGVDE